MVSSLALSVLTLAAMQVFKDELSAEGRMTILGGFVGSWFFVFVMNVSVMGFNWNKMSLDWYLISFIGCRKLRIYPLGGELLCKAISRR